MFNIIRGSILFLLSGPISLLGIYGVLAGRIHFATPKGMGAYFCLLFLFCIAAFFSSLMVVKGIRDRKLYREQKLSTGELRAWQDAYQLDALPALSELDRELSQDLHPAPRKTLSSI